MFFKKVKKDMKDQKINKTESFQQSSVFENVVAIRTAEATSIEDNVSSIIRCADIDVSSIQKKCTNCYFTERW